jgi:hypothetical protein
MKLPVLFFIINIKISNNKRFFIPLPLFLVEMIAEGAIIWGPIIRKISKGKLSNKIKSELLRELDFSVNIREVFEMVASLWFEFRTLGRIELVDVETPDIKVKIYTY